MNIKRLNHIHYQVLVGSGYKSMKAWIHEIMKSWKHDFMPLCLCAAIVKVHENQVGCGYKRMKAQLFWNCQGTWKWLTDIDLYLKLHSRLEESIFSCINAFMFLCHDSWPKQKWVCKYEMLYFYISQKTTLNIFFSRCIKM